MHSTSKFEFSGYYQYAFVIHQDRVSHEWLTSSALESDDQSALRRAWPGPVLEWTTWSDGNSALVSTAQILTDWGAYSNTIDAIRVSHHWACKQITNNGTVGQLQTGMDLGPRTAEDVDWTEGNECFNKFKRTKGQKDPRKKGHWTKEQKDIKMFFCSLLTEMSVPLSHSRRGPVGQVLSWFAYLGQRLHTSWV